ncbi:MAG: dienelactone hydrolase family protein [Acidimicrobiales bacterium]
MSHDLRADTITIPGDGGDPIEAYFAQPTDVAAAGAVVVIHHLPGYDAGTKEIARRFADHGYLAIIPNLYSRDAPGASPDDAAAAVRAKGGVPDERLVGDVGAAAAFLRSQAAANGKVGVIGYCSGGRQSVLSACSLDLDACVDCYGAYVVGTAPEAFPIRVTSLAPLLANLSCPLLGLFGGDDQYPSPEQVEELRGLLTAHAKEFEFHSYDGAGHAFFSVDRPAYRPEAATDAWDKIWEFLGRHLSA